VRASFRTQILTEQATQWLLSVLNDRNREPVISPVASSGKDVFWPLFMIF
jgi:hypothetical protein